MDWNEQRRNEAEAFRLIQPSIEEAVGVISDRSPWFQVFAVMRNRCEEFVGEYEPPEELSAVEGVPRHPRCAALTHTGRRCQRKTTFAGLFCPQHIEGWED